MRVVRVSEGLNWCVLAESVLRHVEPPRFGLTNFFIPGLLPVCEAA